MADNNSPIASTPVPPKASEGAQATVAPAAPATPAPAALAPQPAKAGQPDAKKTP
jgi:hypothetical protein